MPTTRRMGPKTAETRSILLDHAERLIVEDGYAAVTSRQLAKVAGLSPQIVYYYFKTMDDLFEALFSRLVTVFMAEIEIAAQSPNPILSLWEISLTPSRATLASELVALGHHRKNLRGLIEEFGIAYNVRQRAIIADYFERNRIDVLPFPPGILASIMENMAWGFAFGLSLNIPAHNEARDFVTQKLRELPLMR